LSEDEILVLKRVEANVMLERSENNSIVTYKRNGEVVGIIRYNCSAPSAEKLSSLSKRIAKIYREKLMLESR
jgi:hypothetical protein